MPEKKREKIKEKSKEKNKVETVMLTVKPGSETGIYYIPFAGLPFGLGWQDVKDWLRESGCDVDRVVVFPGSTSGWCRVMGKKNFDVALRRLSKDVISHKRLLADGKNAKQSIMVRELKDWYECHGMADYAGPHPDDPSSSQQGYYAAHYQDYDQPLSPGEIPEYASAGGQQDYFDAYSQTLAGPGYAEPAYAGYNPAGGSYQGYSQAATDAYFGDPSAYDDPSGSTAEASGAYGAQAPGADDSQGGPSGGDYLQMSSQNVIVTGLAHRAKPFDLETSLRRRCGDIASSIIAIGVPHDERTKLLRGHAYIAFETEQHAAAAIKRLNGLEFMKRRLEARFTNEEVMPLSDEQDNQYDINQPHGSSSRRKSRKSK